jgi:threonine dehydratase
MSQFELDADQREALGMINLSAIEDARKRASRYYTRTPLYPSKTLSLRSGIDSYLKLECYQPIRVFKIRGALNKILRLADSGSKKSLVTFSAGNHGLAVAYVSNMVGMDATIIVPETANEAKVRAISEYENVKLVKHGKNVLDLATRAQTIVEKEGAVLVHPFGEPDVICGQGTIGLEITEDLPDADYVLVPIGGGGLISGIATAIKAKKTHPTKIIGVCAEGAPAVYKSYTERKIVPSATNTIADGMAASTTVTLNLRLMLDLVDEMVLVNDTEIREAMRFVLNELHIMVEPSGAAPVAAVLHKKLPFGRGKVVSVISGGNANPALLSEILR